MVPIVPTCSTVVWIVRLVRHMGAKTALKCLSVRFAWFLLSIYI